MAKPSHWVLPRLLLVFCTPRLSSSGTEEVVANEMTWKSFFLGKRHDAAGAKPAGRRDNRSVDGRLAGGGRSRTGRRE